MSSLKHLIALTLFSVASVMSSGQAKADSVNVTLIEKSATQIATSHCTGTTITSEWVLLAGHCISPDVTDIKVSTVFELRTAIELVVHGGYELDGLKNDIALIRVNEPLKVDSIPVLDPEGVSSVKAGDTVYSESWSVHGHAYNPILHKESLTVQSIESLGKIITENNATDREDRVCIGESGGGLYSASGTLVGLLSGVYDEHCVADYDQQVYTPIAGFRNWIQIATTGG